MSIRTTLFLRLLPLLAWLLAAGAGATFNDVESGTLLLSWPDTDEPLVAPTIKTDVDIRVSGPLARARVTQHFHNPGDDWAEAIYLFPLPETAAVDRMRLEVGERIIEGEIEEREAAQQRYQKARREGKRAGLVSQERPNLFTTTVANIPPGETIAVTIEYQQAVTRDGDLYSLRFPMTITPRYIPGSPLPGPDSGDGLAPDTDQVPDASRITSPWGEQGKNHHPTRLTLDLQAGFPLADVTSLHHPVSGESEGPGHRHIRLDAQRHGADRDFVLRWRPAPAEQPQPALFTETLAGETYGLLMLSPPDPERTGSPAPREAVFVIDTSGSMGGESLRQARRALLWALDRLRPRDRFNVIEFNSTTDSLFREPLPADDHNLGVARRFVGNLEARGGTEMRPALERSLCGECGEPEALRQVIFLTDGAIGNEDELLRVIHDQVGRSRLFTVGIGSAPNTWFMRQAARSGRGTFTYISDPGQAGETMARLFQRLESPLLTDIRLATGDRELEVLPRPVPDLYAGEPILLNLRGPLPPTLELSGTLDGRLWRTRIDRDEATARAGIHAYWGRQQIDALTEQRRYSRDQAERDELRQAVVDTALRHHLVSDFTSLVAVDKTPARPADAENHRHLMANNSPAGTRFGLAPTATPAALQLLSGLLLLLAAAGLLWLQRRGDRQEEARAAALLPGGRG